MFFCWSCVHGITLKTKKMSTLMSQSSISPQFPWLSHYFTFCPEHFLPHHSAQIKATKQFRQKKGKKRNRTFWISEKQGESGKKVVQTGENETILSKKEREGFL